MGHSNHLSQSIPSRHSECVQFLIRTGVGRALSSRDPSCAKPLLSQHLSYPWSFSVMGFLIVGGTHVFHSDPSDYKRVIPCLSLHWGESPLPDLLSCWLFVALLIAFPEPHKLPLHSGETQTDSTFHLSLSKHRLMTLVVVLPHPVLSWMSLFLLLSLPDLARVVFILFIFCYFSPVTNIFLMQTYKFVLLF